VAGGCGHSGYDDGQGAADGWFTLENWDSVPKLVEEPTSLPVSRPDLVVDSVVIEPVQPRVGTGMEARVYMRNRGSRASPVSVPVVLQSNGRYLSRGSVNPVPTDSAVTTVLSVRSAPRWAEGRVLLAATANPGQGFVELDMENNTAYVVLSVAGPVGR